MDFNLIASSADVNECVLMHFLLTDNYILGTNNYFFSDAKLYCQTTSRLTIVSFSCIIIVKH